MPGPATDRVTVLLSDLDSRAGQTAPAPRTLDEVRARTEVLFRQIATAEGGSIDPPPAGALAATFVRPAAALTATLRFRQALDTEAGVAADEGAPLSTRMRMALHAGAAGAGAGRGALQARAAALLAAGHGGQVLLSAAAAALATSLPSGVSLRDLGEYRLKDLLQREHVYQLAGPDLPGGFPPLRSLDAHPNNLSTQLYPLIGREREMAAATALLRQPEVRLLTLTGAAGAGKTRLGIQVAADLVDEFPHGGFIVSLALIDDPSLVLSAIGGTLGVKEAADYAGPAALAEYLQNRQLLLLLDNFEQVATAAWLVDALLSAAPGLKVLATSRQPLQITGEAELDVAPLALPDPDHLPPPAALEQCPAVALFIARAQDAAPGFVLTAENAPAVARICARLDGLPLAIELAAARCRQLAPAAILARLGAAPGQGALPLLTSGGMYLPARQQTLRGAIGWSYDLLEPGEQRLFARLAVFVGGATGPAISAVCQAGGDLSTSLAGGLASLCEKSLLRHEPGAAGAGRYAMLGTIREYAAEQLAERGEDERLRRQHAAYYLALAEEAAPHLRGPAQISWLQRLEREHGNLRAALAWYLGAAEGGHAALRLAGALWWFWHLHGYWSEARQWLETALTRDPAPTRARALALLAAGDLAFVLGDTGAARQRLDESVVLWRAVDDPRWLGRTLAPLSRVVQQQDGIPAAWPLIAESVAHGRASGDLWGLGLALYTEAQLRGDHDEFTVAAQLFEESLACLQQTGDKWGIGLVLSILGYTCLHSLRNVRPGPGRPQTDFARALDLNEQSLACYRELGDKEGQSTALRHLGHLAEMQGDLDRAATLYEESLALLREVGHNYAIRMSLHNLGSLALQRQDYGRAESCFTERLTLARPEADRQGFGLSLAGLAGVAGGRGQAERAARLLGAAAAYLDLSDGLWWPPHRAVYEQTLAQARAQLDPATWTAAWQAGHALTPEQAIADATQDGPIAYRRG
ncbi:MAG TPA: tetratricopeptide repeat protein [Chloroflexia bacterium]|nr:tetratricopeptide repeat protein [Chloroflexia bacterium]